jgi:hypothetical protein
MEHPTRLRRNRFFACALGCLALLLGGNLAAQKQKVYRWVDEDGNVHYTESLPPDYKDTGHDVLDSRGLVIDENQRLTPRRAQQAEPEPEEEQAEEVAELPRDSSGLPRGKPLLSDTEKQQYMDTFLMLRYDSEQEITDAMNVEIKQLNYDRRLIEGSLASVEKSWRGQVQEAANRQRAGQPVDDAIRREISRLRSGMEKNRRELATLDAREQNIRDDFQAELERYRFLVEKYAEDESG